MTVVLVLLVMLAGLSLGLRTTSVLLPPQTHPLDRMALSIVDSTADTSASTKSMPSQGESSSDASTAIVADSGSAPPIRSAASAESTGTMPKTM